MMKIGIKNEVMAGMNEIIGILNRTHGLIGQLGEVADQLESKGHKVFVPTLTGLGEQAQQSL
jgi:hypothetical protein